MREWVYAPEIGDHKLLTKGDGDKKFSVKATFTDDKLGERVAKMLNNNEKQKELNNKLEEPSSEFMNAIVNMGSAFIVCEACSRTHYNDEAQYDIEMDEEEWQEFLTNAEKNPDDYIYHQGYRESIGSGHIDGVLVVDGCPCNRARRYEDWIWRHRFLITDFFKATARRWAREAKEIASLSDFDETMLIKEDLEFEDNERVRRPGS